MYDSLLGSMAPSFFPVFLCGDVESVGSSHVTCPPLRMIVNGVAESCCAVMLVQSKRTSACLFPPAHGGRVGGMVRGEGGRRFWRFCALCLESSRGVVVVYLRMMEGAISWSGGRGTMTSSVLPVDSHSVKMSRSCCWSSPSIPLRRERMAKGDMSLAVDMVKERSIEGVGIFVSAPMETVQIVTDRSLFSSAPAVKAWKGAAPSSFCHLWALVMNVCPWMFPNRALAFSSVRSSRLGCMDVHRFQYQSAFSRAFR
mmetsp:Transcript_30951/g.78409  ORF Transcript_30951/g.78409 Transcript_30951/m.78409 type:complete len:256 (-) Transcript_30951:43-810(-)